MKIIILAFILAYILANPSQNIVEITDANYQSIVSVDQQQMWMIMFHADWCGHCQTMKPHFLKAAQLMQSYGVKFGMVNEKGNNNLINKYVVDQKTYMVSYPTVLVILGQQILAKVPGNLNGYAIQNWFINYFKILGEKKQNEQL